MPTFSFYLSDKLDSALVSLLRKEEKPGATIRCALRAWYESKEQGNENIIGRLERIERKLDALNYSGGQDAHREDEVDVKPLDILLSMW